MLSGDAKRIVVIKDIPSNLVEEAILILKADPGKSDKNKNPGTQINKGNSKNNDFLVKEAEMIINNYIKGARAQEGNQTVELKPMQKRVPLNPEKRKFIINMIINTALIGSITLLILLVSRLM
jgi:hypothetical protein